MIQKLSLALAAILFTSAIGSVSRGNSSGSSSAISVVSTGDIPVAAPLTASELVFSPSLKVPSKLTARMPIAKDIKDFLDRDFRSRYPVAAPLKIDVVQADVQRYTIFQVPNGFGGFDERHSFRIVAQHADRTLVSVDVNVYRRSDFEPDQDPILLETFRVVGWVR